MKQSFKIITVCLLLANSTNLFAQNKTFTRDYTYQASEIDSKVSSRTNATTEMRNILLREVGTYMRTEQIVITSGSTQEYKEKIEAITAGVVEMKILDEKWNGETYWIKAEMTINPKEVEQKIKEIAEDKQKVKELEESRARVKAAEEENARLRKEIAELNKKQGNEQKIEQKTNDYNKQINTLSAEEYYTKGLNARSKGDNTQAIEYYKQAINLNPNHANAQCNLGFMYGEGKGVIQDYYEAVKWYRKSAEQGNAQGQYNLGVMYENGYGVTQDYYEAVKWYRKSAEQGDANGQYGLGVMYFHGYGGLPQSKSQAIEWFKKAAKQGNETAINYLKGRGITSY